MFKLNPINKDALTFRNATIKNQDFKVKVVVGSEEMIFDKQYVTALMNNRPVKFLKESVQYERV